MPGYKSSWTGTLANSDVLDFLQKQAIMRFSTTAERDTDLTGQLREGMFVYIDAAPTGLYLYTGSEWRPYLTEWNSYTPAWTNLTVGSATQNASYRYIGGDLRMRGKITLAADSTGNGSPIFQTVPNSETSDANGASGAGAFNDSGTGIYPMVIDIAGSATQINFFHTASSGAGVLSSTSPATIANGDIIRWDITVPLDY